MNEENKFTNKQLRFIEEYLIDSNATQAAIRAGYSKKTAYSQGERLLRNVEVSKALKMKQSIQSEKLEVTLETTIQANKIHEEAYTKLLELTLKATLTTEEELMFTRLAMVCKASDAIKAREMNAKLLGLFNIDGDTINTKIDKININIVRKNDKPN
jgi:phage terminase small subunit